MPRTKITGKSLTLDIDGSEYNCDATSITLLNEESDDNDAVTFCEAGAGSNVTWYLDITAVVSTDADSLWTYLWDNAGTTGVAFEFAPFGNATPTATQPHFTGTVELPSEPAIGGDPSASWTFETRLTLEAAPTKAVS